MKIAHAFFAVALLAAAPAAALACGSTQATFVWKDETFSFSHALPAGSVIGVTKAKENIIFLGDSQVRIGSQKFDVKSITRGGCGTSILKPAS